MKIVGFEAEWRIASRRGRGRPGDRSAGGRPEHPERSRRGARAAAMATSRRSSDVAKRAPASARRPLKGLKFAPAGGAARQDHLPRPELSRARQGRLAARQHPEIPDHLHARQHLAGPARPADHPAEGVRDARLRGRADLRGRQARQASHAWRTPIPASPAIPAATKARCANSSARPRNGTWARTSTAPAASARGWSPPTSCRRAARA